MMAESRRQEFVIKKLFPYSRPDLAQCWRWLSKMAENWAEDAPESLPGLALALELTVTLALSLSPPYLSSLTLTHQLLLDLSFCNLLVSLLNPTCRADMTPGYALPVIPPRQLQLTPADYHLLPGGSSLPG
jgi:hypothetical protein